MTSKPQSPPPLPVRPAKLVAQQPASRNQTSVEDKRALLRYVHELHGGTGALNDAALDAVSVQSLLTALRSGSSYASGALLFPGTLPARRGATASAVAAPPVAARPVAAPVVAKAGSEASYKSTSSESDDDDDDGTSASSGSTAAAPATWSGPQEPIALDVDDRGLVEDGCATAALQAFVAGDVLSSRVSPLHEFVRAQLGVDPVLANHMSRTLAGSGLGAADALTLKAALFLLTAPGALGPKELRRFQQVQGSIIAASLPPALDALRERLLAAEPTAVAQACAHLDNSGWSMPAKPTGVLVYQALVRCQWDDLDESNGEPVDDAPALLAALQPLWPGLGCTARGHAAHCIFSAYSRWLSGGAIEALRIARKEAEALAAVCTTSSAAATASEEAHMRAALLPVARRAVAVCSDLELHFHPRRQMTEAVDTTLALAQHASAVLALPPFSAEVCIIASVEAAYKRRVAAVCPHVDASAMTCEHLVAIADGCAALVDTLAEVFAPALERHEPRAVCIAVSRLQQLYNAHMRSWLVPTRDIAQSVSVLRAFSLLVAKIQTAAVGGAAGDPPIPVDCAALAQERAKMWVAARVAEMHSWTLRALSTEPWKLDPGSTNSGALSAVELVRAANEGIDSFYRLKLHQSVPATTLAKGIASVVYSFADKVGRSIGDPDALLPSPPELTRYKKAALDVLAEEHAKAPRHSASPGPAPTPDVNQLLLMFNSMCFLLDESRALDQSIQRHWASLEQQVGTLRCGDSDANMAGFFADARRAATETKKRAVARLAGVVVFFHMRQSFIDGAYMFGTGRLDGRLQTALLDPLNHWMTTTCLAVAEAERNTVAAAMLAAVARGLRHVLLDGGPCRVFTEDDAPALRADLADVFSFFLANGEGLPENEVEVILSPVQRYVDVMAMDTYSLVALYDAAQPPIPQMALLHVICHRGDRAASKWAKNRLHLPKAVGFLGEKMALLSKAAKRLSAAESP